VPSSNAAPTASITTDFATWLRANRERFPVRLLVASRKLGEDGREYRLAGVPALRLWVGSWDIEVVVMFRRRRVDAIAHFEVYPAQDSRGRWYCSECKSGRRTTRRDRLSFVSLHSFEPLLEWCREKVRPGAVLLLGGDPSGWTEAHVVSRKELAPLKRRLARPTFVEPLFQRSRGNAATASSRKPANRSNERG
jgi:hypothetical protein